MYRVGRRMPTICNANANADPECLVSVLATIETVLTTVLCGLPQLCQANGGTPLSHHHLSTAYSLHCTLRSMRQYH
jgi:hypothetical protein